MTMDRRTFISLSTMLPFFGITNLISCFSKESITNPNLKIDPNNIIDLHPSLTYKIISEKDLKGKNLKRRKFLRSNFPFTNFYMYVLKKSRQIKTNITPIDNKTPEFNSKANYKAEWTYFKGSNHPEYLNYENTSHCRQIQCIYNFL